MAAGDIAYLNGTILPLREAHLPLEERATLFADGVYEVLRFYGGRGFRIAHHLQRLRESLNIVEIAAPGVLEEMAAISRTLVERNGCPDATVYWQITRGVAPRDPVFPKNVEPTVFALVYPQAALDRAISAPIATITTADLRWHRCCVKSVQLLANVLARNVAAQAGCEAAILLRGETVTESTSANLAIVRDGRLWTHPADDWILDGITRHAVLECANELGIPVREQAFRRIDMMLADEVFLCGTTTHITPISAIDGRPLKKETPGPITRRLFDALVAKIARECEVELDQTR